MPEAATKPYHRWLRFSIRCLLILMLFLSILLGWWGLSARRQRLAIEKIRQNGGLVAYDVNHPSHYKGPIPSWLPETIGYDWCCNIGTVMADRNHGRIDGAGLCSICHDFPHLYWLDLSFTDATDADISHLRGITSLENLGLCYTKVTRVSIPLLSEMKGLQYLDLRNTAITKDDLTTLHKALPNTMIDGGWIFGPK